MADDRQHGRSNARGLAFAAMTRPPALHRLRTLAASGRSRQLLVVEAVGTLLWARIALLVVPFQRLAARWGTLVPASDARAEPTHALPATADTARAIGWAVTAAASVMPFKAVCMQQAVAAHRMLARRRIPAVLHYGAGRDPQGALVAHAWLDAAGVHVTGYPVAPTIAEIGAFVPPR